jgi:hypothetical protein
MARKLTNTTDVTTTNIVSISASKSTRAVLAMATTILKGYRIFAVVVEPPAAATGGRNGCSCGSKDQTTELMTIRVLCTPEYQSQGPFLLSDTRLNRCRM